MLEKKLSLPGLAFEHTACRLDGQDVEFLDLQLYSKGPLKRLTSLFPWIVYILNKKLIINI